MTNELPHSPGKLEVEANVAAGKAAWEIEVNIIMSLADQNPTIQLT